jgi:hypothetical protein
MFTDSVAHCQQNHSQRWWSLPELCTGRRLSRIQSGTGFHGTVLLHNSAVLVPIALLASQQPALLAAVNDTIRYTCRGSRNLLNASDT